MILTPTFVQELGLIENLSKRDIEEPEGVGIDVRAGEVFTVSGDCFIESESFHTKAKRKMFEIQRIADITDPNMPQKITMCHGDYLLVKTMESVNIPGERIVTREGEEPVFIMQDVRPRSTLHRCGVAFYGTKTDPGYHGPLTYAIHYVGHSTFTFELGFRFANLIFMEATGDIARAYEGQNQGGRVTTNGNVEEQK